MVRIKDIEVGTFILAPMEAVNCSSFRLLCQECGADTVFTQMLDADEVVNYAQSHTPQETQKHFVNRLPQEKVLAVQLGGGNAENLGKAVEVLYDVADYFDLNMGCPVGEMLGRKGGCYLMKHPEKLDTIIPAMKKAAKNKPLTAKIRAGWDKDNINAVQVAQQLESLGVDAITVHPRTRKQRYMKKADWYLIRRVNEAVSIPVIANGDVLKPYHAITIMGQAKTDACMIAREAMDNPLIFDRAKKLIASKEKTTDDITVHDQLKVIVRWINLYNKYEIRQNDAEIQDHVCWMTKGWPKANKLRELIRKSNEKEIRSLLGSWVRQYVK